MAVYPQAVADGQRIVMCGTLRWPDYALALLDQGQHAGFAKVTVLDVRVPRLVTRRRAGDRWRQGRQQAQSGADLLGDRWVSQVVIDNCHRPSGRGRSLCSRTARELISEATTRGLNTDLLVHD